MIILVLLISLIKRIIIDPVIFIIRFFSKKYYNSSTFSNFYQNKTILITGVTSGIGEALAKLVLLPNTVIILSGRNLDKLNEVSNRFKFIEPNAVILTFELDLENYQTVESKYNELKKLMESRKISPKIDVLINNAGISSRGSALTTSIESFHKLMSTNLYGTIELTKLVANDQILYNCHGSIAVISSIQGKIGLPMRTAYSASKHALQGYFDGLRAELTSNKISVTLISPGYVNTNLSLNAVNADGSKYGKLDETTAKGMLPDYIAKKILISIANREIDVIIADSKSNAAVVAKTLLPELLALVISKRK